MKFGQIIHLLEVEYNDPADNMIDRHTSTMINPEATFASEVRGLVSEMGNITQAYNTHNVTENVIDWRRYYRKALSRWFSVHYPIIKDAANALSKKGSALKRISKIPVFAQKYDVTPFTKGNGFWMLHDNIPQACTQIGLDRIGQDYITGFNTMLEAMTKGLPAKTKTDFDPDQEMDEFYLNVKDPNYHQKLKEQTMLGGHQYIKQDQAVSDLLSDVKKSTLAGFNTLVYGALDKLDLAVQFKRLTPFKQQDLVTRYKGMPVGIALPKFREILAIEMEKMGADPRNANLVPDRTEHTDDIPTDDFTQMLSLPKNIKQQLAKVHQAAPPFYNLTDKWNNIPEAIHKRLLHQLAMTTDPQQAFDIFDRYAK